MANELGQPKWIVEVAFQRPNDIPAILFIAQLNTLGAAVTNDETAEPIEFAVTQTIVASTVFLAANVAVHTIEAAVQARLEPSMVNARRR